MSNNFLKFLYLILITLIFVGCSNKEFKTPESVIYANAKYMNEENLSEVMNTIYSKSPVYDATENLVKELFSIYDLEYKVENLIIIEETEDDAQVRFVQTTSKINGPEFKNNRLTGIHQLKKENGSWKIYNTIREKLDYL